MTAHLERAPLLHGAGRYVADVQLDGTLTAVIVRSPEAHGHLLGVDPEAARAVPGVRAVLTAADLDEVPVIPLRSWPRPGMDRRLQPALARDRVRYVGEPVAVVVADDGYVAEDAAELVRVRIDPLPAVTDVAQEPPAVLFEDDANNVGCCWEAESGDVEAAFAEAAVVVRETFRTGRLTGIPIETRGVLAAWDGEGVDVWGPAKFLDFTRRTLAGWFALDPEAVRLRSVDVGGSFGVRGELYPEDFLVPWAARATGRPVRWIEDRREHFLSINHSREQLTDFELAVAADGELLAFRAHAWLDLGAYTRPLGSRMVLLAIEELPAAYRWRAFAVRSEGIMTTKTPVGTVRGPAALEATFARERAIDMAAARLRLDPLELRQRNLILPVAMPFTRHFGNDIHDEVYDSGDYPAHFDHFAREIDLDGMRAACERRRAAGELVGVGVATFVAHSGLGERESARVALDEHGRFSVTSAASDVGQGLNAMVRQVVAEALQVPVDSVQVHTGSTVDAPRSAGTYASRTTIFVGGAVANACAQLVTLARERLAEARGVAATNVELVAGGLRVDAEVTSWERVAPLSSVGEHVMSAPTYGFGCHAAQVALDPDTLEPRVERLAVGYDCGHVIDLQGVTGQLSGAAVQGLGATLLEALRYDADGQLLTTSFMDYLVPTLAEAPDVQVVTFESPAPGNPLGAKGAGEAGVIGVAAAVANAVGEALGAPADGLTTLPLSGDAIFAARQGSASGESLVDQIDDAAGSDLAPWLLD
jgi:carbon-monoxide dehydrogenase large subunit